MIDFRSTLAKILASGRQPPRMLVRSSFYFAWARRWCAHWLSMALGHPSKEPPIR